jgi:uncharacterized protein
MNSLPVSVTNEQLLAFCRRWRIRELALFGSVLREDFTPSSDIDVLVTFAEDAAWSLFDHVQMQQELEALFQRRVDVLSKRAVEQSHNWLRRDAILRTARTLVVA